MANARPYVTAALICETTLEEKNGSLTIVRITDRLEFEITGLPKGSQPVLNLRGLLSLKSGPVKGEHKLSIKIIRPNGATKGEVVLPPIKFLGGDQGQNVLLNIGLQIEEEGLYWFDVLFEEELLTRIPLMIVRKQTSAETQS